MAESLVAESFFNKEIFWFNQIKKMPFWIAAVDFMEKKH